MNISARYQTAVAVTAAATAASRVLALVKDALPGHGDD